MLCEVRYAGTQVLWYLECCVRGVVFFFFFVASFGVLVLVLGLVEEKERKRKRKRKKREEEDFDYRRTLVVAYLIPQKEKPNPFFPTVGTYCIMYLRIPTHISSFYFFKFFLVHCWGCFFFSVQLFPFPRPPFPRSHPS